jgi:hypothetical protein
MRKRILIFATLVFALSLAWAQESKPTGDMSNMDMSGHDMSSMKASDMHDMPGMDNDGSAHAMHSMEGHHMDMGAHMKMTALRDLKPGDQEKADEVVDAARKVAAKYGDYKVALADGFKIFLPNLPQKQYHFTNYRYAFEAAMRFNPDHPTSLLYEKHGDDYKLIGVMYTAPKTPAKTFWTHAFRSVLHSGMLTLTCADLRKTEKEKRWGQMPSLDWAARSLLKRIAKRRAESSCHRSSAGWCMSIPSSRNRKTSGR